jgi:hypothetical protein
MSEPATTGAPALSTNIESGKFDEKEAQHVPATKQPVEEEEEDEDIDALIDDLESNDGHGGVSLSSTRAPCRSIDASFNWRALLARQGCLAMHSWKRDLLLDHLVELC